MNRKRLLLVTTVAGTYPYVLWRECKKRCQEWQEDNDLKNKCIFLFEMGQTAISFKIDDESAFIIMLQDENMVAVLSAFNDKVENLNNYDLYIAYHKSPLSEKTLNFLSQRKVIVSTHFSHSFKNPVYEALLSKDSSGRLIGLVAELNRDSFDKVIESLKKKLVIKLSNLKHRFSHVLLPIDIDLQGWAESGFNEQYKKEIAKDYAGKTEEILDQARALVYNESQDYTVEKIIKEAVKSIQSENEKNALENRWARVRDLLPPKGEKGNDIFQKTNKILKAIQNEKGLEDIKELLKNGNPFNEWFRELDKALDELRDNLPEQN